MKFLLYGTEGGGCKFVISPPFQKIGGAPAPLHPPPGYGPAIYLSIEIENTSENAIKVLISVCLSLKTDGSWVVKVAAIQI